MDLKSLELLQRRIALPLFEQLTYLKILGKYDLPSYAAWCFGIQHGGLLTVVNQYHLSK